MAIRVVLKMMRQYDDNIIRFAKQLGMRSILLGSCLYLGENYYEEDKLIAAKDRLKTEGLEIEGIENVPIRQIYKILYGLPGRDEQIENYIKTLRGMGEAGIPVLGLAFMPSMVWRTSDEDKGRGGAVVTSYDHNLMPNGNCHVNCVGLSDAKPDLQTMWDNFTYFVRAVVPEAKRAGVRIALHPDDPPVDQVGGISRLFNSNENLAKGISIADSDYFGLDLCLGCISEMADGEQQVYRAIEQFGRIGKIFYIHMRDVQGCVPCFKECYIDEGNYNPAEAVLRLKSVGFDGFMIDDHAPKMIGDQDYQYTSRAYALGYLKGLVRMAEISEKKYSEIQG